MDKYLEIIKRCPLFIGIDETGLQAMFKCLSASLRHYEKNHFVFMAGDPATAVGIVLSGSVHVIQEDFWGNRTIFAGIEPSGLFGEAFSCAETEKLPVSVVAAQASDILLIDCHKIIDTCPSTCVFHARLIKNILKVLANKNVILTQKMEILTCRSIREKLLAYLSIQMQLAWSSQFTIPFNRQELAEYLSVDRSALSNELSKMRADRILAFHRNQFELFRKD